MPCVSMMPRSERSSHPRGHSNARQARSRHQHCRPSGRDKRRQRTAKSACERECGLPLHGYDKRRSPGCQSAARGYRPGEANGTRQPAAGGLRGQVPQGGGRAGPSPGQRWTPRTQTHEQRKRRIRARIGGGRAHRAWATVCKTALRPAGLSQNSGSPLPAPLRQAYAAWRLRALKSEDDAALGHDMISEP
jgi:hypothetical protein